MFVISGFLNLYKPLNWTSHDCVAKIRRILHQKKVGHGGTLDPAAAGVLPIALGRATRLLQFLPEDKAYRAIVRFGLTTTTDDLEGEVLSEQPAADLRQAAVVELFRHFMGTIRQVPPRYSAIQVQGKRLYDLARQGKAVAVPERTVTVQSITPVHWRPGPFPELVVDIHCGAGTYIRSIARDLGSRVGTGATLAGLERTHSSGFALDTCLTVEQLIAQQTAGAFEPIAPAIALQHLPRLMLTEEEANRWQQGQKIVYQGDRPLDTASFYATYGTGDRFLGVTGWRLDLEIQAVRLLPKVVFTAPNTQVISET